MFDNNWQHQSQVFEQDLISKSTTFIISLRNLMNHDPIAAKFALQMITKKALSNQHQIASLGRDTLIVTPFQLIFNNKKS